MALIKNEPPIPGMKDSNVDNTKIQNSNDFDKQIAKVSSTLLGKAIIKKAEYKSPFKTQSFKQLIEDSKNELPPRKLIGDLIYENEQTILFSATALGKTILATQIALAVAKGEDLDLGGNLVLKNEVGSMKTIFFDFELSNAQLRNRMGNKIIPDNLFLSKVDRGEVLSGSPEKIFNLIKQEAETVQAKFIIIDNISKIGNELEKSENAKTFMEALFKLVRHEGYTILIISHTPKINRADPIDSNKISGSSKIGQLADAIIGINEVNSDEDNKVYIKQIKTRNGTALYGKGNVICTEIIEDNDGFVKHKCFAFCLEIQALRGPLQMIIALKIKCLRWQTINYMVHIKKHLVKQVFLRVH